MLVAYNSHIFHCRREKRKNAHAVHITTSPGLREPVFVLVVGWKIPEIRSNINHNHIIMRVKTKLPSAYYDKTTPGILLSADGRTSLSKKKNHMYL